MTRDAVIPLAAIGVVVVAVVFLFMRTDVAEPPDSPRHLVERGERPAEMPRGDVVVRQAYSSPTSDGGVLRVIIRGGGKAIAGAILLRPGPEGLVAAPHTNLLSTADVNGACEVRITDVRDTGFGIVAPDWQAQFIASERLGGFDARQDGEMTVSLLPAASLVVLCVDSVGAPVPGCCVTVCRSGALSWSASVAHDALYSLDSANGQHVAWSDNTGTARVSCLAPTQYYLRVEKAGLCATEAGSSRSLVVPPATITVTLAPIEVVRAVIADGGRGYLARLTNVRNSTARISSLGALDAARRQEPALAGEEFWATIDLAPGRAKASERLTVFFANGSMTEVDLPYQPIASSAPILVEPGLPQPTFDVGIEVVSTARESLPVQVRVARLGRLGSSPAKHDFEAARNLRVPCKLQLVNGIYSVTVLADDGRWFDSRRFEVDGRAVAVRLASAAPLVPVTFRREVPRGYLKGLWNIRFEASGYSMLRRQCAPTESEATILVPVGSLRYIVRSPGLKDIDALAVVPASGDTVIVLKQEWE